MRMTRSVIVMSVVAGLALAGVACGDDDDGDATATRRAAASPTSAAVRSPEVSTPATPGATLIVTAGDFAFSPSTLQASVGKPLTVRMDNAGATLHTLTVYEDEAYTEAVPGADTDTVAAGAEGEFTFTPDEAKTYFFRCEVHQTAMEGTIVVE
jgi:plastocyanin